jgi:hypothetical protein
MRLRRTTKDENQQGGIATSPLTDSLAGEKRLYWL